MFQHGRVSLKMIGYVSTWQSEFESDRVYFNMAE